MQNHDLSESALSDRLFYEYAKKLPVIDYHNHLDAASVINDRKYENITQLWITSDPYKHRAMRILGVPEKYITGDGSDYDKFLHWYACIPKLAGNPLYDWSVMEFERVFDIKTAFPENSAEALWIEANEKLADLSVCSILNKFHIEYNAPCTDLNDDVSIFAESDVLAPSLRGDTIVKVTPAFVNTLSDRSGITVDSLDSYMNAVEIRLLEFIKAGCFYTDHALDDGFCYCPTDGKNNERFIKAMRGEYLNEEDTKRLESSILRRLGNLYSKYDLNLQLHIGAKRATSTRLKRIAGPAGGYAGIGNCVHVQSLTALLDDIEQTSSEGLPKTILFTLNPADNAVMSILSGSYSKDGVPAVVSQGPAWWWCDHRQGINDMLDHMSVFSVLSVFVGMTTDSRSILSFVRHEYFRRTLCDWIAVKVDSGEMPGDIGLLGELIRKICYENAKNTLRRNDNGYIF